jgi:hypothetical protein
MLEGEHVYYLSVKTRKLRHSKVDLTGSDGDGMVADVCLSYTSSRVPFLPHGTAFSLTNHLAPLSCSSTARGMGFKALATVGWG